MRNRVLAVAGLVATLSVHLPRARAQVGGRPHGARGACGSVLGFQVLLDRHGFSSGEIDGLFGANTRRALAAFQESNKLPSTGTLNCEAWSALNGSEQTSVTTDYAITDADAEGPFVEHIPDDLVEQANLPSLGYRTLAEKIAERFHASPALLNRLNAGKRFEPGTTITVTNVSSFDDHAKLIHDTSASRVTVEVTKEGSLRVIAADNRTVYFAPVTSGSSHDPLPLGEWRVRSVSWMPEFHYNPDLFWDAKATDTKATIKPGPNNPVGVVWIDLSVEHYGLHGTPEPSRIGYTQSHGCVRLTNWDAARVAALVGPNTPVIFK